MGEDAPFHMWSYWRDKKGLLNALDDYYPNLTLNDPIVRHHVISMKAAMAALNSYMQEKSDESGCP